MGFLSLGDDLGIMEESSYIPEHSEDASLSIKKLTRLTNISEKIS
jgi:hypothetical protein